MAKRMGAQDPKALGDGLLLLIEGTFASGQLFGKAGPARSLVGKNLPCVLLSAPREPISLLNS